MENCSPELMREHERRLTQVEESTETAHKRISELSIIAASVQELTIGFTKVVSSMEGITKDVSYVVETLKKHEEKIEKNAVGLEIQKSLPAQNALKLVKWAVGVVGVLVTAYILYLLKL